MRYFTMKQRLCRITTFHQGIRGQKADLIHLSARNDKPKHDYQYREPPWQDVFAIFPPWRDLRPSSP